MMKVVIIVVDGEYHFGFGVAKLEADYSVRDAIQQDMDSAFLHESIHHIQDIGTLYGINSALYDLSDFLNVVRLAKHNNRIDFVPLSDNEDVINSYFLCMCGDSFLDGKIRKCGKIVEICMQKDDTIEIYEETRIVPEGIFQPRVCLLMTDNSQVFFGGDAIAESMAFMIETFIFGTTEYEGIWPYNACEMVYEHICGEKCPAHSVLIALCYASLQNEWPGNAFVTLVKRIHENQIRPSNMMEVFALAPDIMQGVSENKLSRLLERIDWCFPLETDAVTEQKWLKSFTENLKFSNEWLKRIYSSAVRNEMQYRNAWAYVIDELEKEKRIHGIRNLLDAYGYPVFIDSKGKLYATNDQLAFLLAPYSLRRLLREKKSDCALCQVCLGNKGDVVDECFAKIWQVKKTRSVCIMRYYLYVMGLGETDFDTLLFSK